MSDRTYDRLVGEIEVLEAENASLKEKLRKALDLEKEVSEENKELRATDKMARDHALRFADKFVALERQRRIDQEIKDRLEDELKRARPRDLGFFERFFWGAFGLLALISLVAIPAKFSGHNIYLTPGENSAQLRSWRWWGFSDTWTKIEWKVDREYSREPGWYLPGGPVQFGTGDGPDIDYDTWTPR